MQERVTAAGEMMSPPRLIMILSKAISSAGTRQRASLISAGFTDEALDTPLEAQRHIHFARMFRLPGGMKSLNFIFSRQARIA